MEFFFDTMKPPMDKKDFSLKDISIFDRASLLVGYRNMSTRPLPTYDIPPLIMSDGPNGVRKENDGEKAIDNSVRTLPATCFPCGSALAASFDNELMYKVGKQIALECRYYHINAILGPAINIKRNPLCGRNFEYLSEDPLLSGYLSASYIKGVQEQKVAACVKHYACNNLEKWRYVGSSYVDLRALNDIYLKSFEIAIRESSPKMLMTSYNQINGIFASENIYLIRDRLRNKFNYQGLTVTDWGGMVNRDISLNAGQDLEMPGMVKGNIKKIVDGVKNKMITYDTVNESVQRLLNVIDFTRVNEEVSEDVFKESTKVAIEAAVKSAVLLKNKDNLLPLKKDQRFAIIGDLFANMRFQGSGSALINARELIDNLQAFNNYGVQYDYARGYNQNDPNINLVLENEAVNVAKEANTIIFFGGLTDLSESEGYDRLDMKLDANQIHLLERLTKLNKKIVFIMYGGAPFEIPCQESIDALLFMNLPGQCGGEALRQLLFGEVSPSGRLPFTWMEKYIDVPFGNEFCSSPIELYKESIYVGYRYYSTIKKYVLFPFGHGLSYGKYHFENLKVKVNENDIDVNLDVINDSDIPLSAVIQVYVSKPDTGIIRPIKELKTYSKVNLKEKDKQNITLKIKLADLTVYDTKTGKDVIEDGSYIISVSENVNKDVLKEEITLKGELLSLKENELRYLNVKDLTSISKADFERYTGKDIPDYVPAKRPYTMETPICEMKSFFGRIIQNKMLKIGDKVIKDAKKIKDEKERQRQIKSGTFIKKMMLVNCLRSICYSSGGMLPYHKAKGLLDLANGRVIRGLSKLIR